MQCAHCSNATHHPTKRRNREGFDCISARHQPITEQWLIAYEISIWHYHIKKMDCKRPVKFCAKTRHILRFQPEIPQQCWNERRLGHKSQRKFHTGNCSKECQGKASPEVADTVQTCSFVGQQARKAYSTEVVRAWLYVVIRGYVRLSVNPFLNLYTVRNASTYCNETHQNYSLPSPHDTADIFKAVKIR